MHETNWFLGFLVLASGLAVGALLAWRFGRVRTDGESGAQGADSSAASEANEANKRALLARRDELMAQLRSLAPSSPAQQRRALELEAASVLRELDLLSEPPPERETPTGPTWKTAAWIGGTVVFVLLLTVGLAQFSTERAPGGTITGNTSLPGGSGAPGEAHHPLDPLIAQLEQQVAADPENLEHRLDLAQAYIYSERTDLLINAFQQLMPVLEQEPENPRALTYVAIVRMAMGQFERALENLDTAVKGDPSLTEAWVQHGLASFRLGKWEAAAGSWERAIEQRPDGEQVLRPLIERARAAHENGEPPPDLHPAADPHAPPAAMPPNHPPIDGSATPHAASAGEAPSAGSKAISGRLELPSSLSVEYSGDTLVFIIARPAGAVGGPPTAVKRIRVDRFPVDFSLGEGDTMMGLPFPDSVDLEARIDLDGNAMTRDPSEPSARIAGIDAGTTDVVLTLTR